MAIPVPEWLLSRCEKATRFQNSRLSYLRLSSAILLLALPGRPFSGVKTLQSQGARHLHVMTGMPCSSPGPVQLCSGQLKMESASSLLVSCVSPAHSAVVSSK